MAIVVTRIRTLLRARLVVSLALVVTAFLGQPYGFDNIVPDAVGNAVVNLPWVHNQEQLNETEFIVVWSFWCVIVGALALIPRFLRHK